MWSAGADRHIRLSRAAAPQGSIRLGAAHREHARAGRRLAWPRVEAAVTRARTRTTSWPSAYATGLQDRIAGRRGGSADPEGQVDDLRAVRDGVPDPGRGRPHRRRAGAAHDHRQDPGPRRDAHGAGAAPCPAITTAMAVRARPRRPGCRCCRAAGPGQVGTGQDHAAQVGDGGLDPAFHLADDDAAALGQRPHRPLHLPGGEPPLGRARRQLERGPSARLGPGRPGGQGQSARRERPTRPRRAAGGVPSWASHPAHLPCRPRIPGRTSWTRSATGSGSRFRTRVRDR